MAVSSPISHRIVILGGSYGGVSTAHYLLKHVIPNLPDQKLYQVMLISTSSEAMCRPACPRALISDDMLPHEKLFVSIPKAFEQYPADSFLFVQGTAAELDQNGRNVLVELAGGSTEKINFHALVIATGASTASPLLGFTRDETHLRSSWAAFRETLPTAKNIVIAGGGPAGVETAGELGEFLNGRSGKKPEVNITIVTSDSRILPFLRTTLATKAEKFLAQVGVNIVKNTRVTGVSPTGAGTEDVASNAIVSLESGKNLEADLYIPALGMKPNTTFMATELLKDGRVDTNATLRVNNAGPRIYAVGDVASYSRPAVHLIPILCSNIKRDLLLAAGQDDVGEDRIFVEDVRETQLVPIGKSKGVGSVMGYQIPSFLVWLIKGRDYWLWTTGDLWSGKHWAKAS